MTTSEALHAPAALDDAAVEGLRANLRGPLLRPGDDGFDLARTVWNGMIDRRPTLIARCVGNADVIAAVNFARDHGLLVSVRGGGHNVAGTAVCEGGLMIDLSLMRGVHVDPASRTARVQGGAAWADVDRETQLFGLAVPSGYVSTTGVAGLTLGGGYGGLRSKYGLACDNLISVDIVTADGTLRTASDTENRDLFWGVRGGGGNFGVVTSFEFRCHPVGPTVYLCAPFYPLDMAGAALRAWRDFMIRAPDEYTSNALFFTIPDLPFFPEAARGQPAVGLIGLYCERPEDGKHLTHPVRTLGTPLMDLSGPQSYTFVQSSFDWFFPYGTQQRYWKSIHLNHLGDAVIDTVVEHATNKPTPLAVVPVWHFSGAVRRVDPSATALWSRRVPFMVSWDATWTDPADTERCIAWAREGVARLSTFSDGGLYLNFPGMGEEGEALVQAAYGENYRQLVELKNRYDPTNLFRMNQNIRPTT